MAYLIARGGGLAALYARGGAAVPVLRRGEVFTPGGKLTHPERLALAAASTAALGLTYLPGPNTTGLLPGWVVSSLTQVYGSGPTATVTINGYVENTLFWCQVRPGTFGMQAANCWFAGPKPGTYGSGGAILRCFDDNAGLSTVDNCVLSASPWTIPALNPPGGAWTDDETFRGNMGLSVGLRGGRVTMRFCEIDTVQDGVHINTQWVGADDDKLDIQFCYIHDIIYYQGPLWPSQPEGTHSDCIQFHRGRNITIKYNFIKGAHNSALMIKQEVSNAVTNLLVNAEVAYNIVTQKSGQGYCFNHFTPSSTEDVKYNDWYANGLRIHDNLIYHPTNWDILRKSTTDNVYSNNFKVVVDEEAGTWTTGAAATKNNG